MRKDVRLLFVTTDPARDTPPVVRDYLDRFDPAYEGLVAPVGTVAAAAKDAATSATRSRTAAPATANYQVDHGTYTTGFLDGTAKIVWSEDTTVADMRADLTRLAAASLRAR